MVQSATPKISNNDGAQVVFVAVKEFECFGAEPPYDHPHIYLDMVAKMKSFAPIARPVFASKARFR